MSEEEKVVPPLPENSEQEPTQNTQEEDKSESKPEPETVPAPEPEPEPEPEPKKKTEKKAKAKPEKKKKKSVEDQIDEVIENNDDLSTSELLGVLAAAGIGLAFYFF